MGVRFASFGEKPRSSRQAEGVILISGGVVSDTADLAFLWSFGKNFGQMVFQQGNFLGKAGNCI